MPYKDPKSAEALASQRARSLKYVHSTKGKKQSRAYATAYKQKNRERVALGLWSAYLRRTYGMTLEDYDRRVVEQNGVCAICRRPPASGKLRVDHDHATNKVRGLLCDNCNKAIGLLFDDVLRMRAAADYVEKNAPAAQREIEK